MAEVIANSAELYVFMDRLLWLGSRIIFNLLVGFCHFDPYPFTFLEVNHLARSDLLSTFILIGLNQKEAKRAPAISSA